jgi:DnaJ-class molecular chaperone
MMDIALSPTRTDYYKMLGLDPSAPMEAVQGAYRILARHLHPDVSGDPSTAEAMTRANNIYQALVAKPIPAEFSMDPAPSYTRAQSGSSPVSLYRQVMANFAGHIGQKVDVLA